MTLKCLLINFETLHLYELKKFLSSFDLTIVHYTDFEKSMVDNYDFVVLSGGPIHISYPDDLPEVKQMLREKSVPTLGICLGHQIIAVTFGSKLFDLDIERELFEEINLFNKKGLIRYEHGCYFSKTPTEFEELQRTGTIVTAMRHKSKPFFSVQGHPETSGTFGKFILDSFISKYVDSE